MSQTAKGTFEVSLEPQPLTHTTEGAGLARMSLDKTFQGDLEATSTGEMLSAGNPQSGSAGYVAMEHVTGKLLGREGSFTLQHSSTLDAGEATQSITVVPGSATGELEGLSGSMTIDIVDGGHHYSFDYALP